MAKISNGEKRILEAAEDLFSRHGFNAVSIQRIATQAGVSKATVFHHFTTKQELYITILKRACMDIGAMLQSLEKEPCTFVKPLRDFATVHLKNMFDQKSVSRLILREMTDGDMEQGRALAVEVFGEHFSRLVALIQSGQQEGVLRKDMDPADAAIAIVGLNVFMFQSWSVLQHLPGTCFSDPSQTGERWLRLLLLGITDRKNGAA